MGLGQTLLTIMALMLMGRTILNVNTTTLDVGFTKDMAEYRIIATSLGTSIIELTTTLAFDESTAVPLDTNFTAKTALTPAELTYAANFGLDGAETLETANDIDDYHNKVIYDTLQSVPYACLVKVAYVDTNSTTLAAINTRTFSKKVTVYVTSPFLLDYTRKDASGEYVRDTVNFQTLYSYWFFR